MGRFERAVHGEHGKGLHAAGLGVAFLFERCFISNLVHRTIAAGLCRYTAAERPGCRCFFAQIKLHVEEEHE